MKDDEFNIKYKALKEVLKKREKEIGKSIEFKEFTKNDFIKCLLNKLPEKAFDEIINENTPDQYFITIKMKTDPNFTKKLLTIMNEG